MHKYYESRKIARERWRKTEHGKKWTQDYMREYRARPHVKNRYHEYYVKNKMFWGEIKKAKQRKINNWGGIRKEDEMIKKKLKSGDNTVQESKKIGTTEESIIDQIRAK